MKRSGGKTVIYSCRRNSVYGRVCSEDPADGTIYLISYDSTVSGDDYSYIIVSDEKCAVQFSDRG